MEETGRDAFLRPIKLERPLVFLDLSVTGWNVQNDRIIEVALVSYSPEGFSSYQTVINPSVAIPENVQLETGITYEIARKSPLFSQVAANISVFLKDADLAGFNITKLGIPFLEAEYGRCRMRMPGPKDRHVIDALHVYRKMVPHSLENAHIHYTGRSPDGTRRAMERVKATMNVIEEQAAAHSLAGTIEKVEKDIRKPFLDSAGKLKEVNGEVTLCFGKYRGRSVSEVFDLDPEYLDWIITKHEDEASVIVGALTTKYWAERFARTACSRRFARTACSRP